MRVSRYCAMLYAVVAAGCSIIPEVPNDYALPINDILQNTTCELRRAFLDLAHDRQYAAFGASKWLIGLTLTPKTDREIGGGIGLTGKSTSVANAPFFNTWAFGSPGAPGAAADVKGTRNAGISYSIHSRDLLNVKKYPLQCDPNSVNYNALAQHLGIGEWLKRTIAAERDTTGPLTKLDKPTYSSEIIVKFTGGGNFVYNFPFGTDFGAISGNVDEDITFSLALTTDDQKKTLVVQSLPTGGNFGNPPLQQIQAQVTVGAQDRLDALEAQQQIVNQLRNINTNSRVR